MRYAILAVVLLAGAGMVEARERPIEDLPGDVWEIASLWTEPIKQVARDTRRFDPVSGVWFGLLEGSVRSMERTAEFLMPSKDSGARQRNPLLLRYTF